MKKIIIAISGASGSKLALHFLRKLKEVDAESHLIISKMASLTFKHELSKDETKELKELADVTYSINDLAAPPSSGSFKHDGMIILPCSIKMASEIANSYGGNLISRAADVCLKERRKLVLGVREMPLHSGHLDILAKLDRLGAFIAPPMPIFYLCPKDLDTMIDDLVYKYLDLIGIEHANQKRWPTSPDKE